MAALWNIRHIVIDEKFQKEELNDLNMHILTTL